MKDGSAGATDSCSKESGESPNSGELLAAVVPVIRGALRKKLFVTLNEADGRQRNLDALELFSSVQLKLLQKLAHDESSVPIEDFASYAATVTYHICSDYLRACYPQRNRLRNLLRRVLEKSSGHVIRPNSKGELECAYVGWRTEMPLDESLVQRLRSDPEVVLRRTIPRYAVESISPAALLSLVGLILDCVDAPLPLDDLISIAFACLCVRDLPDESLPDAARVERDAVMVSREEGGYTALLSRQRVQLLWEAVKQLLPWHRAAFLLNLHDGDIAAFPFYGVASIEEIGQSLDFSDQQFIALADSLGLSASARAQLSILTGSGQKFAAFWNYLPLDDTTIAFALRVARPQVIGYRSKAVERLRRMLKGVL